MWSDVEVQKVKLDDRDVQMLQTCKDGTHLYAATGQFTAIFQKSASSVANSHERLQIPDELAKVISTCEGGVDVCDAAGTEVGFLLPVILRDTPPYWELKFSKAEWERMENEPGGSTLAGIVQDWKKTA